MTKLPMLKIAFSPIYKYELPPGHRFPMEKYELLPEQLLYEGTVTPSNFFAPVPIDERTLLLTHSTVYWEKLKHLELDKKEIRRIGFPLSEILVRRGTHIAGGTLQCARFALLHGVALNIAGGTHHAFSDRGEGFCLLNDIAIASNALLQEGAVEKILVIDLDVHQGNGTARLFAENPRVFTFSMHGEKNYPLKKERSDLDIPLPDGCDDGYYLSILRQTLPALIDTVEPDLAFYLSGVDILDSDKLGRLKVSLEGCRARDKFVFEECRKNNIPVAVSMGGGYSDQLSRIVEAHANTFRIAQDLYF